MPGSRGSPTAALVAGMVAGALLMMATLTFYVHWLAAPRPHHGWVVSAMVVLGSQVLVSSGLGLAGSGTATGEQSGASMINLVVTAVALTLVILSARGFNGPDPLLLGLGLGIALTSLQVAEFGNPALAQQPSALMAAIITVTIVGGYVSIASLIWRDRDLPAWARRRLALTVSLIGSALVTRSGLPDHWIGDLATAMALVAAASLWTSATFVLLRDNLEAQRQRSAGLEGLLLEVESSSREGREQLHEIRSTLAGAASASRLLSDHSVDPTTHARLERAIGAELDRLERLVSHRPADPGPVDLDATLDVLLASHRARGRDITWEPTGASVYASHDDVTEALNILLDNAATHGGAASTVEVTHEHDQVEIAVSDEGPGVPDEWRDQIFDWGVHSNDSPGQGIGLNLARRLISAQGGSLTLAKAGTDGSSFVIRLPAARRSEENDVRDRRHQA